MLAVKHYSLTVLRVDVIDVQMRDQSGDVGATAQYL